MPASLQSKITIIPNAISHTAETKPFTGNGLVFIANLEATHAWKGLDQIIAALEIFFHNHGWVPELTVIGDGDLKANYMQKVIDAGLTGSVHFVGRKSGAPKDALIRRSLALIAYPTSPNDAFPTVLVEAWGQGTAVIVSDIGPMPSLVKNHKTGVVAPANNPKALAEQLHWIASNPARAAEFGEAGRKQTSLYYTWPTQVQATIRLLEAIL